MKALRRVLKTWHVRVLIMFGGGGLGAASMAAAAVRGAVLWCFFGGFDYFFVGVDGISMQFCWCVHIPVFGFWGGDWV